MKKIQMQGIPETMLQTLYARAAYSKKRKAKFYDDKAVEIVSRMDSCGIGRWVIADAVLENVRKSGGNGCSLRNRRRGKM